MTDVLADPHTGSAPALILKTPAAVDVFTRILTHGPIGRIDVGRQTGLSQAAVTKAVTPLIADGFLSVHGTIPAGLSPGRPVYPLSVVPRSLVFLGIKVNLDEVVGVSTTLRAEIIEAIHLPIADTSPHRVIEAIAGVVASLREGLGESADRIAGVGVSVSGDVDTKHGLVRHSPLLGWSDVSLGSLLAPRLGLRVLVDNDVRALTIAEQWFGVGIDAESFAIVTIGAGIGSGIYLNGDVVSGANGVAGEIGHLPLASDDLLCTCGRHGCVEAEASSSAILRGIRASTSRPDLTMQEAIDLAHSGEPNAVRAFDRAGTVIGSAIAALVNLVGPSIVLVAGESVADYDLYEQRIREAFAAHAFGAAANCRIVTRSHTFDDWARGAAASAIRATVRQTVF